VSVILYPGTLVDFVTTRFDDHGPWNLVSAVPSGVTARRPRAGHRFFYWKDWFAMPAHPENSLQAIIDRGGSVGGAL
jgi:hypothetical protein